INECEISPCAHGLTCFNTIGSYECHCPEDNDQCTPGCFYEGQWNSPGSSWFSEDCRICTCSSFNKITCNSDSDSDCPNLCSRNNSTLSNTNNKCCSQCANLTVSDRSLQKKSCRHQLYPDIYQQSGEMWHFQCQTCECLDGEIDCWPIDCPPINCHNAFLPEGDCCFRCPEEETADKCTHWHANNTECQLLQNTIDTIESGTRVTLPLHHCITCKCQDGDLCCTYDYDCVARASDPPILTPAAN
ncbi:unnamed protein product, partial [Allacma fusca]